MELAHRITPQPQVTSPPQQWVAEEPLNLKGQEGLPPALLPPSCYSHTLPTPAQPSTTVSIQQLVQALLTIGQNMPHPPTTSQPQVQAPDAFDGSSPQGVPIVKISDTMYLFVFKQS